MYADECAGHVHEWTTACLPAEHLGMDGLGSSSGAAAAATAQSALLVAQIWDMSHFEEFKISSLGREATGVPVPQYPNVSLCPLPWAGLCTLPLPGARIRAL